MSSGTSSRRPLYRFGNPAGLLLAAMALALDPPAKADEAWRINVGPAVSVMPQYPGSKGERIMPLPMLDIDYGHCLFLNSSRGLGGYFLYDDHWQLGGSVWLRRGRHPDQGGRISGLDGIGTAAEAELFAAYRLGPWSLGLTAAKDLGGSNGLTLDADAGWHLQLSPRLQASLGAEIAFGSSRYMQAWFGVTPDESRNSGLPAYSPGAGFRSAGPKVSLVYTRTRRWTLSALAGEDFLIGKAGDSPVISRKAMPMLAIGASYRFTP